MASDCTYNRQSTDVIEQAVDSLDRGDKAFIAFGMEGCAGVLDKSGYLIEIGDLQSHYPTFVQDVAEQFKDPTPWKRKVVGFTHIPFLRQQALIVQRAVVLNPFRKDEHFLAFADGHCYFKCTELGRYGNKPGLSWTNTLTRAGEACEQIIQEWAKFRRDGGATDNRLTPSKLTYPDQTNSDFAIVRFANFVSLRSR